MLIYLTTTMIRFIFSLCSINSIYVLGKRLDSYIRIVYLWLMKTIKKVTIVPRYVYYIPKELEEGILYISKRYGTVVHNCLCGCGLRTVTPIDNIINGKDMGWKLIEHDNGNVSLTPSIGNQKSCVNGSHYILTKNVANFV